MFPFGSSFSDLLLGRILMAYLNSSSTQRDCYSYGQRTSCWKGYPARPSQRDQRDRPLSRSPLRRTYLKNDADEETGYYVATDVKPTTAPEHLSKFDPALWPVYCYVWLKGVGVRTEAVQEFFLLRQLGEDEARSADKLLGEFKEKIDAEGRGAFKKIKRRVSRKP